MYIKSLFEVSEKEIKLIWFIIHQGFIIELKRSYKIKFKERIK